MTIVISTLTVFFEEPFWVGLYECECDGEYQVCKITFGAEPTCDEACEYLLKNYRELKFSPSIDIGNKREKCLNPKRMQREINKQLQNTKISTKAQRALQLEHEQNKLERKTRSREQQKAEREQAFALREKKRQEKHRGH